MEQQAPTPCGFCSGTGGFTLWLLPLEQVRGPCHPSSFLLLTGGVSAEGLPGAAWQILTWERRDLSQLFLVMPDMSFFSPGLYLIYLLIKRETFCRTPEEFLKHLLNVCLSKNLF